MAAFASSSRHPPPIDMTIFQDLYEVIESNPPALEARKVLIQQCMEAGWVDAAKDAIADLLQLDPFDEEAHSWSDMLSEDASAQLESRYVPTTQIPPPRPPRPLVPDIEEAQLELLRDYEALRIKAAKLLRETSLVRDLTRKTEDSTPPEKKVSFKNLKSLGSLVWAGKKKESLVSSPLDRHIQNLTDIADGRISSAVQGRQPESAPYSFVFRWEHAASEVYVTGTFDDWSKSEKLIQTGNVFEKKVILSPVVGKIHYKFVVDGNWVADPTAPQEFDDNGISKNVLTEDQFVKHTRVKQTSQPGSAQSVARMMEKHSERAVDIAVVDLEAMARWLRSQDARLNDDGVREALVKRLGLVSSALPDGMKRHAALALMHVEHELLRRTYVCDETMYGDKVVDIPRARFLVTEDNYGWDMEELVQAIASNGGVVGDGRGPVFYTMRNPLSRQMFTTQDIQMIVQHPLGKRLAAMQVEQGKLSKGVRPKTIEELEKMSAVLLADMSLDQMESRHVVDGFLGYVATLPESEQQALDRLRVPAKDSHTGQAFDTSIGEAVRDAKANRVCIHKTGDFLQQAARYLKRSK